VEVLYVTDEAFHRHDTGSLHPERPARLRAVDAGVEQAGLPLVRLNPKPATPEMLHMVHSSAYVDAIERFCRSGGGHLDADTIVGPNSWDAAVLAAGAGPTAIEVMRQSDDTFAFLAVRPPGHHARYDRAMGFCLFNNVAVAAAMLRENGERVAILDWDVHHGNGTQESFSTDPGVLYLSLHQFPYYPYQGDYDEIGDGPGRGTVVNVPFPAGTAGDGYRYAWEKVITPVLEQYSADWLLISSGYDAHAEDPLAELRLEADDFGWMAAKAAKLMPASRTVVFLEGGYHLPALTASSTATLQGLAGARPLITDSYVSPPGAFDAVDLVAGALSDFWKL
jgi:acetoin utilization deacetylase AcuC-like enzyme